MPPHLTVHLPHFGSLLRQGAKHLLESTVIPLALFYVLLTLVSFDGGLIAALAWSLLALVRRVVLRRPLPGVLLLATVLLVARTILGLATESPFLYFLQPTLQNFLIAFVMLATVPHRRPLIAKLADDFCAFPAAFSGHPRVRLVFRQLSLLWALVFLANGAIMLWTLARQTVGNYVVVSTAGTWTVIGVAIVASLLWFRRALRGEGISVRMGSAPAPA